MYVLPSSGERCCAFAICKVNDFFIQNKPASRAAALLPNDPEELADVVNRPGLWVKDRNEKLGNRYFQILEPRCAKSQIGSAAVTGHWVCRPKWPLEYR